MARGRSRNPESPNALVASGRKVRLGTPGVKLELGLDQAWQPEAWSYWRKVPEVKQLMLFLGNQLAKLRIFLAIENPDDPEGDPLPITAENSPVPERIQLAATAELARLMTHDGGISELLRRLDLNLEIPGEAYLVGYGARAVGDPDPRSIIPDKALTVALPERWELVSKSAVLQQGQGDAARTSVKQHPGDQQGRALDKRFDAIIRIYQADPEWPALADSAMQGVLFDCRILMALTAQVLAVANSQMHAGILTVPNELSFGPAVPTEGDEDAVASEDPLDRELDDVFSEVVETPDSLMTIRPTLLRGPGQYLSDQFVRYIEMGRKLDDKLDAQIEQRVRRIARGLNAPVETMEGHDATTFANAKQIDRDLFDDHVEPRATGMVNGLTSGFLTPNLRDAASEEDEATGAVTITDQELWDWSEEIFVWYDPSSIIREPDPEAGADAAHAKRTISDAAYRKAKGFGDDDAPEPLELIIRAALDRGTLDPTITVAMLQQIAQEAGVTLPEVEDLTGQGASGAPSDQMRIAAAALMLRERIRAADDLATTNAPLIVPPALSASGAHEVAGPNPGANLLAIDSELRTRLLVASNDAMERALERAGNRLRSRLSATHRPLIDGLPPREFARALGRGLVADAGVDLTGADAWAGLEPQFDAWVLSAQRRALDELDSIVGGLPIRDDLEARQDEDRSEAWAWFLAALGALLADRIFDPSPEAPAVGEHDITLTVPTGLVRAAIARAGGAAVSDPTTGVGAVLADGGTRPAGGVGAGELIQQQLRDFGASVRAYRWVYGPSLRSTFLPHAQLDGTLFTSYDDPRLTNGAGFPPFPFYLPGDHYGCRCDVELVIVPPAGLVPLA